MVKLLRGVPNGLNQVAQHLGNAIQGKSTVFDEEHLQALTDMNKIKKIYKLGTTTNGKGPQRKKGQQEALSDEPFMGMLDERKEAEATILGLIALRGAS